MGMTKAELEDDRAQYDALLSQAKSALVGGCFSEAVRLAVSSWEHIDGMMQYERRYEDREFDSIEGIDIVLRHAPLLFEHQSLDKLEALLETQRRIEKNTSADMADKLAKARALMWDAHRMWGHLEAHPDARQDELRQKLGGEQERWRLMAEGWEGMGIIRRTGEGGSYRLALSTRLDEAVLAKCPACGVVVRAPKTRFLGELACPKCRKTTLFVMLARDARPGTKE
jgi:hypothetical protein